MILILYVTVKMSLEGTDAGEGASAGRGSPTQDHPRDSPAGGIPRETSHGGATPVEQTQAARVPYVCRLSADLVRQAQQELNEKPEWRSRDIQALRDMALAHPGSYLLFLSFIFHNKLYS